MTQPARSLSLAAFGIAGLVILLHLKIAWASDDAYIVFRSLEQLFAGRGPRWNPDERVQVFTSPLWFWYLAAFRTVSSHVFLNSIVASLLPFAALLWVLRRFFGNDRKWIVAMLLLAASNGFFDHTSSGLESPLAYLLLAVFALAYVRCCAGDDAARSTWLPATLAVAGLVLFCRLDLLPLVLPPLVYALARKRGGAGLSRWLRAAALGVLPLAGWTLFSLVYYGSLLPNTVFAKLGAGIPAADLAAQGLRYLWICLRFDSITVLLLPLALGAGLASKRPYVRALAAGIVLDLVYVVAIGGDFMLGRFLAYAYLYSVMLLLHEQATSEAGLRRTDFAAAAPLVLYLAIYDHTPANSRMRHENRMGIRMGVTDERAAYADASLWVWWRDRPEVFPAHHWSTEGRGFARSKTRVDARNSVGFFGFHAGIDKSIVDLLALCDPFLSRLPVDPRAPWRIGHFRRPLPFGYLEAQLDPSKHLPDPRQDAFYTRLRLVTRGEPLMARHRLKTIFELGCGFRRAPEEQP